MYTEFFGLSEVPFSIAPDPAYLFLSDRHREALAHLTFGFNDTGGFVLLTGEVGTGKTTVCRCLLEQLPANTRTAFILNPALDAQELLAAICDELHLPYDAHLDTIKILFDRLRDHLLERHDDGENTVLIIDEAQHLRPEVLEQLRLLTNLETNKKKLLKVVLIGQPELQELLRQRELRQLAQRITARYHLLPLSREEVIQYVQHRLKVAGCQRPIFTRNALNQLHKLSDGVPRLINLLCDRAMLAAYAAQQWQVDGKLLKAASREVQGLVEDTGTRNNWLWQSISAAALVVIAVVTIWQFWPMPQAEPVVVEAEAESDWLASAQQSRNLPQGFKELAAVWGVNEPRSDCQSLRRYGLQCLWGQQPINRLLVLEHPALLKLEDESGMQFYAVLVGVQGERVRLHMAGQQLETDMDWLLAHYQGSSVLVWQPPQGYLGSIGTHASASQIQWLETQLSFLQGQAPRVLQQYDAQLAERIRWFQLSQNLEPDGIAGDHTLIQLNAQMGDVPVKLSQEL
ncbi:AAA family ATPase [Neiella marina]|uniref:AAA family ATPase n=1 Tax=Neiella holothuriorum TaxID=2870530 RepID=A0ABS7EBS7_9GAMM|nr:ExeA family protein [Neiella holothuriorum]MBW8189695.1 AAA family ATPase [Neiella holothuriorum]